MNPPSTTNRPTAGQALVILFAALVLIVTGCFGAFGVGSVNRNALQALAMFAVLPLVLLGLVGIVVGGIRLVRAFLSRTSPDTPAVPARPPFGQTVAIFTAGVVAFSGACMGLVDGGSSASALSKALFSLVFVGGVVAAAVGFTLMAWPRRTPDSSAGAPPPPAAPDPPTSPADVPPMEPRA